METDGLPKKYFELKLIRAFPSAWMGYFFGKTRQKAPSEGRKRGAPGERPAGAHFTLS